METESLSGQTCFVMLIVVLGLIAFLVYIFKQDARSKKKRRMERIEKVRKVKEGYQARLEGLRNTPSVSDLRKSAPE